MRHLRSSEPAAWQNPEGEVPHRKSPFHDLPSVGTPEGLPENLATECTGLLCATGTVQLGITAWFASGSFMPAEEPGIPQCVFHDFRHGNATLLDQIGPPMAGRQDRLGHTEAQTTMGYTHAVKADERRVANELGKILHVTARNEQNERPALTPLTLM